jgi:hypothetical protein
MIKMFVPKKLPKMTSADRLRPLRRTNRDLTIGEGSARNGLWVSSWNFLGTESGLTVNVERTANVVKDEMTDYEQV